MGRDRKEAALMLKVGDVVYTKSERFAARAGERCVITKIEEEIMSNHRKGRWVHLESTERTNPNPFEEFVFTNQERDVFDFERK